MQFNFLQDNLLIVCPNTYQEAILKYLSRNKKMFSIKFMSLLEYQKNYYFDYDEKTIHYLKEKGMKVENALNILNNLYYVDDKKYHHEKLDYLVNIKKELNDNQLLIDNPFFQKVLMSKKIVVYGYGKLDSFNRKMFRKATIIPYENYNQKYQVYKFNLIEEEIEFVFQKIATLLKNGIDINKISLMNLNSEYYPTLKRMQKFYNIKVMDQSSDTIMGTILGKTFYQLVLAGKTIKEIEKSLKPFSKEEEYSFIVNLINKYSDNALIDVCEEIKYELTSHQVKGKILENTVKIKNVFDYVADDEYVFLMNFNSDVIPLLKMDTDYITNDIREKVNLLKIEDENSLIKENTLNYISSIKNLIISYKEKSPFNTYYSSVLLESMDYELLHYERSFNYSDEANRSIYTKYLDNYVKYGVKDFNMDMLYANYQDNQYLAYRNEFTGINQGKLIEYLNNELTLSYSSVDNLYKCAFKYYLNNILKVDLYEETFMTIIGSLFHYCLSKMNDEHFNLEECYTEYLQDKKFNNKERFFLNKLKNDLSFVIEIVKKHQFISGFTNMLYEKKIDITLNKSPYVHFKGYVDKIMYKEQKGETLVSIIDYKTGNPDIKIKNLEFGLSMQLPIYLYLVNHSNLFSNMKFTGFYLQHILNIDVKKSGKKSLLEQKENNLKLTGYTTDNLDRIAIFDATYENSAMIKGLKLKKDGTISLTSNILTDDEIEKILELTNQKILDAMQEILKGHFTINPKIINDQNVSCEYCHFKDICYHEEKNNVYLKSKESDQDAQLDEGTE